MELNKKTLERIVYNSVVNDAKFRKSIVGAYFPYKNYRTEVSINHVRYSGESDDINIYFKVAFLNLDYYSGPKRHWYQQSDYNKPKFFDKLGRLTINKLLYTQYNRELTLQEMTLTQEDKIRKSLNEYLEFDSDELFSSKFNLVRIFGGSIRDIIAGQDIRDIDILCGSKAIKYVELVLERNGYQYMEMLNGKDLQEMYSEIHVINEPHTWMKGKKIVQLIRPSMGLDGNDEGIYKKGFSNLISNVDLSCCGVSYDGEVLYQDYQNAILHCQSMVFSVNTNAKMYSAKRIYSRKSKLISRGWREIEDKLDLNRDLKISNILDIESILPINKHESVYGC